MQFPLSTREFFRDRRLTPTRTHNHVTHPPPCSLESWWKRHDFGSISRLELHSRVFCARPLPVPDVHELHIWARRRLRHQAQAEQKRRGECFIHPLSDFPKRPSRWACGNICLYLICPPACINAHLTSSGNPEEDRVRALPQTYHLNHQFP